MGFPIPRALPAIPALCLAAALAAAQEGRGTEDDPWLVDVDALLEQGFAVVITPEDTIALADAGVDTVRVQAPRLRVSELVRRIGERMERDVLRLGVMSVTSVTHAELFWDDPDPAEVRREEHLEATRVCLDADGEQRMARLYHIVRKYEGGELVEEETDAEIDPRWQEDVTDRAMDMPFVLMTAGRYRYEILERVLIGEHLVFKIGFTPCGRFEPGLDGVVWIDYSDLVIRRMEGRVSGPTPVPLVIAAVPRFVWTQKRVGARWLTDELYAEIEMTDLPTLPDRIELRAVMKDYVFSEGAER